MDSLHDQLADIFPVDENNYKQGSYVQEHIEEDAVACINVENILEYCQVPGTGYGKKLCESLNQSEEYSL
jgi:hypothetical protein